MGMRIVFAVLIVAVVACSRAKDPCSTARDAYLSHVKEGQDGAIATIHDPAQRAAMRKHADDQLVAIRERFVDACRGIQSFDATCFDDHDHTKRHDPACTKMRDAIERKIFSR